MPAYPVKDFTSRPPGVTSISIKGSKDYVQYNIKYYVYPTTTVKMIKVRTGALQLKKVAVYSSADLHRPG